MKKCFYILLLAVFAQVAFAKTFVAVVETRSDEGVLTYQEKLFLTDKLREHANKVLPAYRDFVIMTRDNIETMLPPGKSIEDCEGTCLAETGRNISADYIAQARVMRFADKLSLTVELYETKTGKLVSSFTGTSDDAVELLDVIEESASGLFREVLNEQNFLNFPMGETDEAVAGFFDVNIKSNPPGAMISVDGDPHLNCRSTPCSLELSGGSHRISFAKNRYAKRDTSFSVTGSGQTLDVKLKPTFGILKVTPTYEASYEVAGKLTTYVDDRPYSGARIDLDPGSYNLEVRHSCYEPSFSTVTIQQGKTVSFERKLNVATGNLLLYATRDGEPAFEKVYLDGREIGTTPFDGEVPVCGRITIGKNREKVPVTVSYQESIQYSYRMKTPAVDTYGAMKTKKSYYSDGHYQEAQSENRPDRKDTVSREKLERPLKIYFNSLLGIGINTLLDEKDIEDQELRSVAVPAVYSGLSFGLFTIFAAGQVSFELLDYLNFAVGAGVVRYDPIITSNESETSESYDYQKELASDYESLLPSGVTAPLVMAEASLGTDFVLGARWTHYAASKWATTTISGFFEILGFLGFEVGSASSTELGTGVMVQIYCRIPYRGYMRRRGYFL